MGLVGDRIEAVVDVAQYLLHAWRGHGCVPVALCVGPCTVPRAVCGGASLALLDELVPFNVASFLETLLLRYLVGCRGSGAYLFIA